MIASIRDTANEDEKCKGVESGSWKIIRMRNTTIWSEGVRKLEGSTNPERNGNSIRVRIRIHIHIAALLPTPVPLPRTIPTPFLYLFLYLSLLFGRRRSPNIYS